MSRIMRVFLLLSILMFGTWYLDLANEINSLEYEMVNCDDSASNLCKHLNISTTSCEECVSYWNERVHMCLSGYCKSFWSWLFNSPIIYFSTDPIRDSKPRARERAHCGGECYWMDQRNQKICFTVNSKTHRYLYLFLMSLGIITVICYAIVAICYVIALSYVTFWLWLSNSFCVYFTEIYFSEYHIEL